MTDLDPRRANISERDIEDYLHKNPQSLGIDRWIERQLHLPSGIADLVGLADKSIIVVEIKNVEVTSGALTQVCRYAKDLRNIFYDIDMEYGVGEIGKVIVSPFGVEKKRMHEAIALNVDIHQFEVELKVKISSAWYWNDSYREYYHEELSELAQSESFIEAANDIDLAIEKFHVITEAEKVINEKLEDDQLNEESVNE